MKKTNYLNFTILVQRQSYLNEVSNKKWRKSNDNIR